MSVRVTLEDVRVVLGGSEILHGVSLAVGEGEVVAVERYGTVRQKAHAPREVRREKNAGAPVVVTGLGLGTTG